MGAKSYLTRTYAETRDVLRADIRGRGLSPYAWAKMLAVSTGTVYDILGNRPVSSRRLNTIRPLLGLPPIREETVKIDPDKQKVVNRQGPTGYVSRQARLTEDEALVIDEYLDFHGWASFSQWFRNEILADLLESY